MLYNGYHSTPNKISLFWFLLWEPPALGAGWNKHPAGASVGHHGRSQHKISGRSERLSMYTYDPCTPHNALATPVPNIISKSPLRPKFMCSTVISDFFSIPSTRSPGSPSTGQVHRICGSAPPQGLGFRAECSLRWFRVWGSRVRGLVVV